MASNDPQEPLASWNGEIMPLADVKVSVLDRGFLFGDAVYEMLRVYAGRPWKFNSHLQRLQASLASLGIKHDTKRLVERIHHLLAADATTDGSVYLQVTRGAGPRSHGSNAAMVPNELIYVRKIAPDPYATDRPIGVKVITTPDIRWQRPDIKCTNLLPNVMASQAASDAGAFDALFVKNDGRVVEGSRTSLFAIHQGQIRTAPLSAGILPGVTRETVIELARALGLPIVEQAIHIDELTSIDELFVTGTTTEVLAVVTVDSHTIGTGQPGPITLKLQAAYRQAIAAWLADEPTA